MQILCETAGPLETLIDNDRGLCLYAVAVACAKLEGEFWECGVYRGGSAAIIAQAVRDSRLRTLRLFDTFRGIPDSDPSIDIHQRGEFASPEEFVRKGLPDDFVSIHAGLIPRSFLGLEACKIAFAHVDLDLYWSTRDAVDFIWPRLVTGGAMVFDDYHWKSCPGVERVLDERFCGRIIELGSYQAMVKKEAL